VAEVELSRAECRRRFAIGFAAAFRATGCLEAVPFLKSKRLARPRQLSGFALYRIRCGAAHCELVGTRKTIPAEAIAEAVRRIAGAIAARHRDDARLVLLGIANGGVVVCRRLSRALAKELGRAVAEGTLNIAFHRDDIGRHPIPKIAVETALPGDIEGATVVLVDDVLFSGRTVRAALEEVFTNGRPARVELAVLVDRGNHRLPIAADYVGFNEPTTPDERVTVVLDDRDPKRDAIAIEARA
jgi:pyrimidine operon attenuation protein/uracil phosphoribosyltransferase